MNTLATDFLLKESPNAIAIVDTKLNYINYSNQWQSDFTPNKTDIIGKHLFDVISEMPILFNNAIIVGLTDKKNINAGQKFILPSGKVQWLKWKISPIRNDINILEGLVIYLEDITADKRELELLQTAETVARIGGWEVGRLTYKKIRFIGPKPPRTYTRCQKILYLI